MRMRPCFIGFLGLLLFCRMAEAQQSKRAAGQKEQPTDIFDGDMRVMQKARIHCEGLSVGELVALLAKKSGIGLTADQSAAEEKVVVFTPLRPLRDTFLDLAALLNDTWEQDRTAGQPRYILRHGRTAVALEARLLKSAQALQLAQLDAQVKALAETPEQLAARPADDPIRKSLSKPENRTATEVYAALNTAQRTSLFDQHLIHFGPESINPQLSAPVHRLYQTSLDVISRFRRRDEGPSAASNKETLADYERRGVQFVLHNCGGKLIPAVQCYSNFSMHATLFAEIDARNLWLLPLHGDPYSREKSAEVALAFDAEKVQKVGLEKEWVDRLRKLAELTGASIMADYYRSRPVHDLPPEETKTSVSQALKTNTISTTAATTSTALDRFCEPVGYLWWARPGNSLLFRKRDWYEQQLYEVPDNWLLRTIQSVKQNQGEPSLADVLGIRALTARQVLGLNSMYTGFGYSYSLMETAGAPEFAELVEREIRSSPDFTTPLTAGRSRGRFLNVEGTFAPAMQTSIEKFLKIQAQPIYLNEIRFFRVDASHAGRAVPEGGFREATIDLNWSAMGGMFGHYSVRLPLGLPDDGEARRDRTRIEME